MKPTKKILIADDHMTIRTGLRHILNASVAPVSFGEVTNAAETLKSLKEEPWDLLILDINMPGRDGLQLLHEIRREYPVLKVLIFSMYSENQFSVRTIRAGAYGYLTKSADDGQIIEAVQTILNGRKYIIPEIAELLSIELIHGSSGLLHETLSDRELQTFLKVAAGKSVTEVADELSLSVSTVNTYRARVLEKMNLKSNADLIRYAIENKLV